MNGETTVPRETTVPQLQVLFLEDNPTDALLVCDMADQLDVPRLQLTSVSRLTDALDRLRDTRYDAALLDLNLPDSQGIDTVERLRRAAPELPLVVLTGTRDAELVSRILARGAQDYVVKGDADPHLLGKALQYAVERHRVAAELDRRTRELVRSEMQIREQAALLDEARDAILVVDLERKVRFWNRSAMRLYDWNADEVSGRDAREFLYRDLRTADEAWVQVLETGEWLGELATQTRSGRELLTDTRMTLVRDEGGNAKAVLLIATDITERKKLEVRVLRAQRLDSIGALAGGIAHDLNNVLAPIVMSVDMLREKVGDAEGRAILQTLAESAQRGADMVRQVLMFARGVEGQRVAIRPAELLASLARIFNDTFFKAIDIRVSVDPEVWMVQGDRTQLHQVFTNLAVNARDAMASGGQLLLSAGNLMLDEHQARQHPEAVSGPYVQFAVVDTGTGISPELLDRIFDPFFTTKEIGKGTGLGLASVRGIVRAHGGFVTVYSEPGKGTTFRVYLPAQLDATEQSQLPAVAFLPRGRGELVLVVDDEAAIRQITQCTLEAFGYRTLLAEDGPQALAHYARRGSEIAVVLTDMMMPVLDGASTIRALKAMNPEVITIATSGVGNETQTHAATSAGCHRFLAKPYSAASLLTTLDEVLGHATAD